ncbi:MAG: Flp pilus assembly complex ATPase component TadA [Candidatus Riflebacteria bacterium]|nr:Flp pilus assembly complex ATPase component TadA [Candidatus Riflebacteria bacterium]
MIRKRLGDALVDSGLINQEQLKEALGKQKEMGKRLGKVLTELKFCTDESIAQALAGQLGIPFIQMEEVVIPPEILKLIPETIVRSHTLMPVARKGKNLTVAMADPLDAFIVDEIRYQTNLEVEEAIAPETHILNAIRRYYGAEDVSQALKTIKRDAILEGIHTAGLATDVSSFDLMATDEAAVVNFVSQLIRQAINEKASDIHLEPEEDHLRVRFRVDGVLNELVRVPKANQAEIISRVKIMAEMDISEKRLPQDGRIRAKLTDKNVDLRVSSLPVVWGEKIVIRVLDKSALNLTLRDVGFEEDLLVRFENAVKQPNGIILLNGPTGSGKTSTLYAALNFIISPRINISTAEDPVEMQVRGINQVHVKTDIGLTFARTLRSLMRQDPNVIMVGEIRDQETAQIAVEAAMTGHLVLSTLHTNDAPSTIGRLIDLQVEPYLIASTLLAALAQRLVRRICIKCRQPHTPSPEELADLQMDKLGITEPLGFFRGKGCTQCGTSGYKGRTAIHEMMTLDDVVRRMVTAKATSAEIRKAAIEHGMVPLRKCGIVKASRGVTTIEEVLRVTKSEEI